MQNRKIYVLCKTGEKLTSNKILSEDFPHLVFDGKIYPRDKVSRYRWTKLKEILEKKYFKLENEEFFKNGIKPDFEFHFFSNIKSCQGNKKYLILPEHDFIDKNCRKENLRHYDKVFTNIKKDVDNIQFHYVNWPFDFAGQKIFLNKNKLLCMISTNKNLNRFHSFSGYSMRAKIIKWFIKNKPEEFDLYGKGWDSYFSTNYYFNRLLNFFRYRLKLQFKIKNKVYRGFAKDTFEIIKKYKFMICFENIYGENGYSGGAMADALMASTVPIYLGRPDIKDSIPENCFIDFRNFSNFSELYSFIKNMKEDDYLNYLENINTFLHSNAKKEYDIENFANIIIKQLNQDVQN